VIDFGREIIAKGMITELIRVYKLQNDQYLSFVYWLNDRIINDDCASIFFAFAEEYAIKFNSAGILITKRNAENNIFTKKYSWTDFDEKAEFSFFISQNAVLRCMLHNIISGALVLEAR
jgi:hypothetical protein